MVLVLSHLVLTEKREVKEYFQGFGVSCHHNELGYATVESFCSYRAVEKRAHDSSYLNGLSITFVGAFFQLFVVGW